jgi:hypothetical protein
MRRPGTHFRSNAAGTASSTKTTFDATLTASRGSIYFAQTVPTANSLLLITKAGGFSSSTVPHIMRREFGFPADFPWPLVSQLMALAVSLSLFLPARAQDEPALESRGRVFSQIGPGFQAIRRGAAGQYYVLVAPSAAVQVLNAAGEKIGSVPAHPAGASAIVFGDALDLDASGRLYVADRGGNAVNVYAADGSLLAHVPVSAPTGVAALPGDEFAVSTNMASGNAEHLVAVYDFHGTLLREFGNFINLVDDAGLNRRLNRGRLASDSDGNVYFAFEYLPEPTVRKYDRYGYLAEEMTPATGEFQGLEQAARREIARANKGNNFVPDEIVSSIGVEPSSQELWMAVGGVLLHFDRAGHESESARTLMPGGARLEPTFILAEPARLLLGNDPLGLYEVARAGKSQEAR